MINVIIGTTTGKTTKMYPATTSIREILEDNSIDYGVTQISVDGTPLPAGYMDKTLSDMNITNKCLITSIVKTNNA